MFTLVFVLCVYNDGSCATDTSSNLPLTSEAQCDQEIDRMNEFFEENVEGAYIDMYNCVHWGSGA